MTAQLAKLAIDLAFSEAATTATTMTTTATIMSTTMANNTTIASPGAAREPDYSPPVMVLLGLLASIASFVTVVGNLLVVTAFFVERQLRSATNYFIASLAITDLLIGMFSMNLYTLYLLLGQWPLGRIVCDLWLSLDYTACLTSQYTVFCITVDRFCSVKIPAKYRKWRTERKVQVMVAATWVLPALLFVPPIFAWPYVASSQRNDNECFAEFSEDPVYNTVLTICYFWVTLAVMIGLYIGIYRVALQLARKSEAKRQKVNNLINLSSTGGGGAGGNGGRGGGGGAGGAAGRPAASESAATSGATGGHAGVGGGDVGDDGGPHDPLMPSNRKAAVSSRKDEATGATGFSGSDRKMSKRERKKLHQQQQQQLRQRQQRGAGAGRGVNSSGDEDRSSSPVLPSDSDNGQDAAQASNNQKQHRKQKKQQQQQHHHYQKQQQAKTGRTAPPLSAIQSPVLVETPPPPLPPLPPPPQVSKQLHGDQQQQQQPQQQQQRRALPMNASSDSDYHTASGLSYENPALDVNGSLAMVHFAVPVHQMLPDDSQGGQQQKQQQQQQQPPPPYSLCAPSDQFEGLRYIDEDSIRSNPSIDSMRLLVELLPKRWWRQQLNSGEREGGRGGSSPVWKRRTSFQRSSDCRRNSETTKTTAAATPTATTEDAFLTDRIVTSVVELPASGNSCELTILDQTDEEAPRARTSASRRVAAVSQVTRYLRDATRRIRRQVGSRAAGKTLKLAKKQSRTENRARKALKTISLILGAFVACWTPYHVFILIRSICKGTCLNPHLYNLGYWLCYMNSPINPFCYALANAQFKKTFLRIFRLDLRRR